MLTINNTLDGYLKDVEIKGNTVQDPDNLADIRSVGDKVEGQELYEIPVLSSNAKIQKMDGTNPVKNILLDIPRGSYIYELDENFNIISNPSKHQLSFLNNNFEQIDFFTMSKNPRQYTFAYPKEATYIKYANNNKVKYIAVIDELDLNYKFIEDKLTILSPTPLEKVGDVRDRIIEKDGVWGVEKHIKTDLLKGGGNEDFRLNKVLDKGGYQFTWFANMGAIANKNSEVISSTMNSYVGSNEEYSSNMWIYNGITYVIHHPTISTKDEIKLWLQANPTIVKFASNTPQFIPLPHSQQVKLRTFANKTNISFLTEIEGTIKAQVPKSIGATVNTHTEQINNLNKELDRVKKLEESTVSTVTTESDFTTVEATSNGYFEDVKLEGKTLVNLCTRLYDQKADTVIDNGNTLKYTKHPFYAQCDFKLLQNLKQNTTYTVVLNVANFVEGMSLQVNFYKYGEWTVCSSTEYVKNKGVHTILLTTNENIADHIRIGKMDDAVENLDEYITLSKDVIILEGDHTQNPPSFFEGLKSVGQDVDEVSVESVKGDGNLIPTFDGFIVENNSNNSVVITDTKIEGIPSAGGFKVIKPIYLNEGSYICSTDGHTGINARVRILNTNRSIKIANVVNQSFAIDKSGLYIVSIENNGNTETSFSIEGLYIYKYGKQKPDLYSYQSDKKRLLYYNNETQTWEKPILREWDSIEKHIDGKYYYHQRSAEVVLNGSENWNNDTNSSTISPATYRQSIQFDTIDIPSASFNTKTSPNIISDLLPTVIFGDVYSHNHIGISISGTGSVGTHIIINNNFTDVTELKQWLQANNLTLVYQLAEEKVYECTNIDLITYANETNFIVESGVLSPKTTLKVHNNISNVVSLLQKKVSLLESNVTSYMITQNRLMLASRYNADTVSFKVDVASFSDTFEYDNDLYELILNNILVGKDNYNREYIENLTRFYWMDFVISDEMYSTLFEIIEEQHNPKIEEETPLI